MKKEIFLIGLMVSIIFATMFVSKSMGGFVLPDGTKISFAKAYSSGHHFVLQDGTKVW